ncbi:unnamed protein product [Linum trigynum]|uniref:Uncharacterized protein n=1 Tax=Linum trigynum TaxID=586398 RepID=A0AAV2GUR5_9ROSI
MRIDSEFPEFLHIVPDRRPAYNVHIEFCNKLAICTKCCKFGHNCEESQNEKQDTEPVVEVVQELLQVESVGIEEVSEAVMQDEGEPVIQEGLLPSAEGNRPEKEGLIPNSVAEGNRPNQEGLQRAMVNLVTSLYESAHWQGCLPSEKDFQEAVTTDEMVTHGNYFDALSSLTQFEVEELVLSPLKDPINFPELGKEVQQKKKGKPGRPPKGAKHFKGLD